MKRSPNRAGPAILGLFACALTGFDAKSADAGRYTVVGVGVSACSNFTKASQATDEADYRAFKAWLAGYITGHNFYILGMKDVLGDQRLRAAVSLTEAFCHAHPDANFADASMSAVAKLLSAELEKSGSSSTSDKAKRTEAPSAPKKAPPPPSDLHSSAGTAQVPPGAETKNRSE